MGGAPRYESPLICSGPTEESARAVAKPVTRVLAIDIGTRAGYAIGTRHGVLAVGALDLRPGRFEGGGMRFVKFRSALGHLLDGVTLVVFEEVRRHLGVDSAHCYGGLLATLTAECEERGIPYRGVPVATIKRAATGRGNADKQEMIAAAVARWPELDVTRDDEADALWCLEHALREWGS